MLVVLDKQYFVQLHQFIIFAMKQFGLLALACLIYIATTISTNNVCTFRTEDKLFTLTYLEMATPYKIVDSDRVIYFNFCFGFIPAECPQQAPAFSFVVTPLPVPESTTPSARKYRCERYSSNSSSQYFNTSYEREDGESTLTLTLQTEPVANISIKKTEIQIRCSARKDFYVSQYEVDEQEQKLEIYGQSVYGCPVLQISSFWKVFHDHPVFFGVVMFLLGFYLLFYGRSAVDITVFLAVFLISMIALGSLLTLFISPNSSNLTIYSSFLLLLFVSCLFGYGATKLIGVSVFFVGACNFLGLIIGLLVSSIFSKVFDIYAEWTVILFVLLFSIPCGLLTFKYHDDLIIASSAFTGAYFVVRPISWIFGGFPNELLLYKAVQSSEVQTLPGAFFIYVLAMIILAIVGSMYQRLKLHRQNSAQQIQINIIQRNIEAPIDAVKVHVDKLIQKFRTQPKADEGYHQMGDIKQFKEIK